ncbi:hypothetical protein OAK19_04015 [Aureispira]|nr:hypothetical protein [Aureispira sp.]
MNYSYLGISITQFILLLITWILFPFYVKNNTDYVFGNLPKKSRAIYYTGFIITLASIIYLIYYSSLQEVSDSHDIANKILFSLYLFLTSIWSILLILYYISKKSYIYTLIKITVILYALTSVGLFINICMDTPWTTNDKIAFASIFFITLQAVVGDAIFWNKYFPKLK